MFFNRLHLTRYIRGFPAILLFCGLAFSRTPPVTPEGHTAEEIEQAKDIVQKLCTVWKTGKSDRRSDTRRKRAQEKNAVENAIDPRLEFSVMDGKLVSFEIREALSNERGILIRAELTFLEQIPPTAVNGVHNFHLVKEGENWEVKTIVPPIAPPVDLHRAGGGRPGL